MIPARVETRDRLEALSRRDAEEMKTVPTTEEAVVDVGYRRKKESWTMILL
jgi:hypothetical protein